MKILNGVIAITVIAFSGYASAENVTFKAAKSDKETAAILKKPQEPSPPNGAPAVVIFHHGGGCIDSQTPKYAEALTKAGYVTLEPCLFKSANERERSTVVYLPQVFGALKYLAQMDGVDKNRISVIGGSYGAALGFVSATQWAYDTHADTSYPKFGAHAAFYQSCWLYERFLRARQGRADLPATAYDKFTGSPVRIYAGGMDDYDSRDPKACETMIGLLAPEIQSIVSLKLFPDATHGWDHAKTETFFEPLACKGRGCNNRNIPDAKITQEGIEDLIVFLKASMPSK